jgi:o-succinylbenzoate synthase
MRVTGLSWTTFRLPLSTPFPTAAGEFREREGLILRLASDAGVVGLGEASPHPAQGRTALAEVEEALERLAPSLLGAETEGLEELRPEVPPVLACAIDVAACDTVARATGVSVARLLSPQVCSAVPVNAVVGTKTDAEAVSQAAAARKGGFACVKLKVGTGRTVEEERRRVAAVRDALGPGITLRLDANGAWRPDEAISIIEALAAYDLEMVEQPVAMGDLEGMAYVRAAVDVPIAADEDVTSVESARRVLEEDAADILVVKPMVVGGLRPARMIVEVAEAIGAPVVVTTTVDTGIGTAAALHLAATLPPGGPACGLATGYLLAADLLARPLAIRRGRMELPDGPGLGVGLDESELARYGGIAREVI